MKRNLVLAVLAVLHVAAAAPASAQPFPSKPIRVVVPFDAGGAMDVIIRVIGKQVSDAGGPAIVVENKWRAQRYGVRGTMVGDNGAISVADLIERVIEETAEDAEALDSLAEMRRCRTIVSAGTSADVQIAVYEAHRGRDGHERALEAVTNWIAVATLE